MSDTWMLRLFFDASQREYMEEQLDVFCPQFCVEKEGVGCMEFDSADWQLTEALNRLAETGAPFWGWRYAADDELGARFATHNLDLPIWETVNGRLVVQVWENDKGLSLISARESLDYLETFFEIEQEAKRRLPAFDPYSIVDTQRKEEFLGAKLIASLEFQAAGFTEVTKNG